MRKKSEPEIRAPEAGLIHPDYLYFLGAVLITAAYTCMHGWPLWEAVTSIVAFVTFEVAISPKIHPSRLVRTMLSVIFATWILLALHITGVVSAAQRN